MSATRERPDAMKTYVDFFIPGTLFAEHDTKVVQSRDTNAVLADLPKHVFAFQFYDQASKKVEIDGEVQTVFGPKRNVSGKFYPFGKLYTLAEVENLGKGYGILASNMRCNEWKKVVKTRCNNFQPFEDGDQIL